jgi:hypothetical protein
MAKNKSMNDIKQKVLYQQLRIALISSYCYLIFTGLSTMIVFIGAVLCFHGNITIVALTSISSILAHNKFKKIAGDANLRIDRLLQEGQENEE